MAKNYVQEGEVLDHVAGGVAVAAGSVVVMGRRIGIALGDIPALGTGSVSVAGVWAVNKQAAEAVGQGDELYWDADGGHLTKVAEGNIPAGFAAAAAPAGADVVDVKINA